MSMSPSKDRNQHDARNRVTKRCERTVISVNYRFLSSYLDSHRKESYANGDGPLKVHDQLVSTLSLFRNVLLCKKA